MIEAIGWLTIFIGGGFGFASLIGVIVMHFTRSYGLGSLAFGDMAFKAAIVLWIGLFLWFAPITISFGV